MKQYKLASVARAVLACFALVGCGTIYTKVQPVAGPDVQLSQGKLNDQAIAALSKKKKSWVSVERTDNEKLMKYGLPVAVSVFNGDLSPVRFGPTSIRAMEGSSERAILDQDGIRKAEESTQNVLMFLTALDVLVTSAAGNKAYRAGNASAIANAQQQNAQTMQTSLSGVNASFETASALTEEYSKVILREQDVAPLKTHGGFFLVKDYKGSAPLELQITVGGEVHRIAMKPQ